MKRYVAWMTIAMLTAALLAACAGQPPESEESIPNNVRALAARELQLRDPNHAAALLHNMRAVLERGSLARRLFFTEEQLTASFGGTAVEWRQNTPTNVFAQLGPIDILPVRARGPRPTQIGFLWYDVLPGVRDKPAGNFSLACTCELTSADIEAVFGDVDRTVDRDRRFDHTHYPAPAPATRPLGNKVVTYRLRAPDGYASSFEVRYDPDGRVAAMTGRTEAAPTPQPGDAGITAPSRSGTKACPWPGLEKPC